MPMNNLNKKNITIIFCIVLLVVGTIIYEYPLRSGDNARAPSASSVQKGRDYNDVVSDFQKRGFINIKTETIEDLITGWLTKDGEVERVMIDGDENYSADSLYPKDVEVIIEYHTFPSKAEKDEETTERIEEIPDTEEKTTESTTEEKVEETENRTESKIDIENSSFVNTFSKIPDYSGEAFIELNNNIPYFSENEKKSTDVFEIYSELDKLGRCGMAFANICPDSMPTEERGDIGDIKPSGWHTVKYSEIIDDNYLYNRSHLIAYSLAGENSNEKNLITGTRYLNQDTMQIFELKVLDYVRNTGNHVLYRVTPDFEGDNLLAKGVQMEAWSVEDNGNGICFNVFCYNVQPNIDINYETGESEISKEYYAEADTESSKIIDINEYEVNDVEEDLSRNNKATVSSEETTEALGFEDTVTDFIVNKNTGKIHSPNCRSVNDMAEHNKWEYTGTLNDLKRMGYVPCARCLGDYK